MRNGASITGGIVTLTGQVNQTSDNNGSGSSDRGVDVEASTIKGSGDVSLTGIASAGTGGFTQNSDGLFLTTSTIARTGGALSLTGTARGNGGNENGIRIGRDGATAIYAAGAVSINGTDPVAGVGNDNNGVSILNAGTQVFSTNGGTVSITGSGGGTGASSDRNYGVTLNDATIGKAAGSSGVAVTMAGPITFLAATGVGPTSTGFNLSNFHVGVTGYDQNIKVTTDSMSLAPGSSNEINTTGVLTIEPRLTSFKNALNWPLPGVAVPSTLGGLVLGKPTSTSDVNIIGAATVAGNVQICGTNLNINAALTATGNVNDSAAGAIVADKLLLQGGNVTLDSGLSNVGTLAASGVSGLSYLDSNTLTLGTVGATNGISASGAISIATASGDLTVAKNIGTSNATATALTLNAGQSAAAGTATGGNLVISGSPSITVEAGGSGTLYSGSTSETSLAGLIGSGTGRFRYDSDEVSTGYTTALATGLNAIYREQPAITITARNQSITHADALPTWTYTSDAPNGDVPTLTLTDPVYSSSNHLKVGHYAITPTLDGLGYAVTANNGTLAVGTKTLTLDGFAAVFTKVYDGGRSAAIANAGSLGGVISGDAVNVSHGSASYDTKDVGTGKTVTLNGVALTGADAGNYSIADTATDTASITARPLTLNGFSALDKVYDRSTAATINNAGTLAGIIQGETVSATNTGASFDTKDVGTGKTVTLNGISLGGADAGNYSIAPTATTRADISARLLTLGSVTALDKVYDRSTAATLSGTLGGVIAGDAVTVSNSGASFDTKDVGTNKTVTVSGVSLAGADAGNYSIAATATTHAAITARPLNLSGFAAQDKVYDQSTAATIDSTGTLAGVILGDTVSVRSGSASFDTKDVGANKTVTLYGVALDGVDAGNYSLASSASTTAAITARLLTLSGFEAASKTYDGLLGAGISNTGTLGGVILGDAVSAVNTGASFDTKNAGVGKRGADAGSYSIAATATSTADITPKALTVTGLNAQNKVYDGGVQATLLGTGALDGVLGNDAVDVGGQALFDSAAAGARTVLQGTVALTGAQAGNYSLQWTNGSGMIQKAPLTVRANDDARFVTETDTVGYAGVSFTGLVHGETADTAGITGTLNILRSNAGANDAGRCRPPASTRRTTSSATRRATTPSSANASCWCAWPTRTRSTVRR